MSEANDRSARPASGRVVSLDAYRGFVMLAMASAGLGIATVANGRPENPWWALVASQVEHVVWRGCAFWDLIQPSFMFLVGASLPFSEARRRSLGRGFGRRLSHAVVRSIVLVALGVFLASNGSKQTEWTFTNVLAQIGLGYTFVFLVAQLPTWAVWASAALILAGDWLAFALYDFPGELFLPHQIGWDPSWVPLPGFFANWDKNINAAAAFDRWFLNLFPRPDGAPFRYNPGGYTTLNFVPSMATMLFGVLAGRLIGGSLTSGRKAQALLLAGVGALVVGAALDQTICPSVKRIWTPSWAVISAGWASIALSAFVGVFDALGWKRLAFPLIVVGSNSIVMYLMAQLVKPWVRSTLRTHLTTIAHVLGPDRMSPIRPTGVLFPGMLGPVWESAAVLFCLWLVCFWMYRSRIFVKI